MGHFLSFSKIQPFLAKMAENGVKLSEFQKTDLIFGLSARKYLLGDIVAFLGSIGSIFKFFKNAAIEVAENG